MSRIAAVVAIVALLVAGGLWFAARSGAGAAGATGAGADGGAGGGGDVAAAQAADDGAAPSDPAPGDEAGAEGDDSADEPAGDGAADGSSAAGGAEDESASGAADEAGGAAGGVELGSLGGGFEAAEPLSEERRTSFEAPEQVLEEGRDYAARLETTAGTMILELYEEQTPTTVNNLVFLARHGYYDGIVFHRVLEDFMAQTGDPTGTGTGGPGYTFDDEIVEGLVHDRPGTLSMANAGPGTNGSQFFLTFVATPWLDGRHTVFGRVVDGLDVLDDLTRIDPQQPQAAVRLDATVADLRAQGIEITGADGDTVETLLERELGAVPVSGQSFTLAGYRGVLGSVGDGAGIGLWPQPDRIESFTVYSRAR